MRKYISIIIPFCMIVLFIGCVQFLLLLRMSFFDFFSTFFFYCILFSMLWILIASYKKKINLLFVSTATFMIAFMSVKLSLRHIEDYHFQRTISKGDIIKSDLQDYKVVNKVYPESLKEMYKKSKVPKYSIGLIKYNFDYYCTDTSYRLYFNHFDGSSFINNGESHVWNFYD